MKQGNIRTSPTTQPNHAQPRNILKTGTTSVINSETSIFAKVSFKNPMKIRSRIQENGRATIPAQIRKRLNLQSGDLVVLVETKEGILIKPAKAAVTKSLDKLGKAFRKDGVTLRKWIERGRVIRKQLIEEKFNLKEMQ